MELDVAVVIGVFDTVDWDGVMELQMMDNEMNRERVDLCWLLAVMEMVQNGGCCQDVV